MTQASPSSSLIGPNHDRYVAVVADSESASSDTGARLFPPAALIGDFWAKS